MSVEVKVLKERRSRERSMKPVRKLEEKVEVVEKVEEREPLKREDVIEKDSTKVMPVSLD